MDISKIAPYRANQEVALRSLDNQGLREAPFKKNLDTEPNPQISDFAGKHADVFVCLKNRVFENLIYGNIGNSTQQTFGSGRLPKIF